MSEKIPTSKTIGIRESGFDERWLQDQIYENPSILGLGELEVVSREKKQPIGGKIDLLLKDPEDESMYEVEIMLGPGTKIGTAPIFSVELNIRHHLISRVGSR